MNNIFHQTDETFYETQYGQGYPSYSSQCYTDTVRPSSSSDGGEQIKNLLKPESKPLKEEYRERYHQLHRNQQDPVGGQKFLRSVDSLKAVKDLRHGTKSRVDNDFSNIIFPGCSETGTTVKRTLSAGLDDARRTMTHGKRTNRDRNGDCFWKIFDYNGKLD
uniref:Uncharacterized protein n=1 Tax=Anopheles atroparvus TaxID=41427 RepID=A0A182JK41_ANOAO